MTEWVLNIVERLGYVGIACLVALENLIPPIPSEVILPISGFSVAQGKLGFVGVLLAATIGSVLGALMLYFIGQRVGELRLRRFIERYSWIPFIDAGDIDRAHGWFDRHGGAAVFFGRLIPVVRSGISLPAGFTGMALPLFVLYTTIGSAIWNGLLIGAGWWLGERWEEASRYTNFFEYAIIALLVVLIGRFIWRRWRGGRDESPTRQGKTGPGSTGESS